MVYMTVTVMGKGTVGNDSSGDGDTNNAGGDTWFSTEMTNCIYVNLYKSKDFQMHYLLFCLFHWSC
jgi:hypothetical protein